MTINIFDNEQKDGFGKFRQMISIKSNAQNTTGQEILIRGDKTDDYEKLVAEVYSNIHMQLNDVARLGVLDIPQWKQFKDDASEGLLTLIYIKYYKVDEELIDKDALFTASKNYMILLSTRVLNGRDREMVLRDIDAKKQNIIMGR